MTFLIVALTCITVITEPYFIIEEALRKTTLPPGKITVNGIYTDTDTPVSISREKKQGPITITEGDDTKTFGADDNPAPLWLKLFFRDFTITPKEQAGLLQVDIADAGIDMSKTMISRTGPGGPLTIIIGRSNPGDKGPCIEFYKQNRLPFRLLDKNGREFRFSAYHRSPLPLAFPGRIQFLDSEGTNIKTYEFIPNRYNAPRN